MDIQNTLQRALIDREVIDEIPTGKSHQSYALLVPGMNASSAFGTSLNQDAGGTTVQTVAALDIHGSRPKDGQNDHQQHGRQQRLFRGRGADVRHGLGRRNGGDVRRGLRARRRGGIGGRRREPGPSRGSQPVQRGLLRQRHRPRAAGHERGARRPEFRRARQSLVIQPGDWRPDRQGPRLVLRAVHAPGGRQLHSQRVRGRGPGEYQVRAGPDPACGQHPMAPRTRRST